MQNGTITLDGCTLRHTRHGFMARGGAAFVIGTTFTADVATALLVESGSNVRLSNATVFRDCTVAVFAAIGSTVRTRCRLPGATCTSPTTAVWRSCSRAFTATPTFPSMPRGAVGDDPACKPIRDVRESARRASVRRRRH